MADRTRRRDPLEDVLVEMGRLPPPRRTFSLGDIEPRWEVVGNCDEWIGTIEAVEEECLVVHRGRLTPKLYVPLTAVGEVREGVVSLNVPAKWIGSLDWSRPPRTQHIVVPNRPGR